MVKASRVLDTEIAADADVPYEETRLARRAPAARKRLAALLLLGALGALVEMVAAKAPAMLLGAAAFGLLAWAVLRGRLGAVIAVALVAVLAALIPFTFLFFGEREFGEKVVLAFIVAWAAAMLPDVLTLVRDAELQYTYGRWARREV